MCIYIYIYIYIYINKTMRYLKFRYVSIITNLLRTLLYFDSYVIFSVEDL